jgi:hypothetical protein
MPISATARNSMNDSLPQNVRIARTTIAPTLRVTVNAAAEDSAVYVLVKGKVPSFNVKGTLILRASRITNPATVALVATTVFIVLPMRRKLAPRSDRSANERQSVGPFLHEPIRHLLLGAWIDGSPTRRRADPEIIPARGMPRPAYRGLRSRIDHLTARIPDDRVQRRSLAKGDRSPADGGPVVRVYRTDGAFSFPGRSSDR